MIKINLATRKQSVVGEDLRESGGTRFPRLGALRIDSFKDLPLKKLILFVLAIVLASQAEDHYKDEQLQEWDAKITQLTAEQTRLRAELDKTKGFEEKKRALEADELMIRTKIDTIKQLIAGRGDPPKVLMALSQGVPKEAWLSEFSIKDGDVKFLGDSMDFNEVSDFMTAMKQSAFFGDVHLVSTEEGKDETGTKVAKFQLSAKRR